MLFVGNMGVDLCRCDRRVAQQVLDVADVDAVLEEARRHRVADHVWGEMERDACGGGVLAHQCADRMVGKTIAFAVPEEEILLLQGRLCALVLTQGGENLRIGNVDQSLTAAFSCNPNSSPSQVNVLRSEIADLGYTCRRCEQEFQYGDITHEQTATLG